MKILTLNQVSCRQTDIIFGISALRAAVAPICLCGMIAVLGYLGFGGRFGGKIGELVNDPRWWETVGLGLLFLLLLWLFSRMWRAAGRSSNWVMRVRGNEVLIKYRSYLNWSLSDDDPQVIVLQSDEIKCVRKESQQQLTSGVDRTTQMDKAVYLQIELKDSDTTVLENAIAIEVARPGRGTKTLQTKSLDYPVRVENGAILLPWGYGANALRPSINTAIHTLEQLALVGEKRNDVADFTAKALRKLGKEEQKGKLVQLAMMDRIAADMTAKDLYGCSLREATQIVDNCISAARVETPAPSSSN